MLGRVLWFDDNKGYGFLSPSEESVEITEDIFFHWTEIKTELSFKTLMYGQPVEFELKDEGERKAAVNVRPMPYTNEYTGKPFLLASLALCDDDYTIEKFQLEIGSKEKKGLKYLYILPDTPYILAISRPRCEFNKHTLAFVVGALVAAENQNKKIILTGENFPYDILKV